MIPKTIVQFWNNKKLPDDIAQLQSTWLHHNPSFAVEVYDSEQANSLILKEFGQDVLDLYRVAALPAMQSDIFRLAYCLAKGGIYVDMATRCKNKIDELLAEPDSLTVMRKWHGGIWNGFIACAAGNPVLTQIWKNVLDNLKSRRFDDVWKATGPYNFNQVIDSETYKNHVCVIPQTKINPYFDLVNDLEHKKQAHWSEMQKQTSIYLSI
ncbi:glycosyltransferase [Paraglaciecola sp. 25GB23A]|uniref:glycosyltransferase family 32 protein n=1 Tax=Paraglaciecola sp. 25GB23A TaxID=3156068 RepID=UPI0032AF3C44